MLSFMSFKDDMVSMSFDTTHIIRGDNGILMVYNVERKEIEKKLSSISIVLKNTRQIINFNVDENLLLDRLKMIDKIKRRRLVKIR